jgi:hypothetical protein
MCESTTSMVVLVRASYKYSEEPFKDTSDHLLKYYFDEQQWSWNQEMLVPTTSKLRRLQSTVVGIADMEEGSSEDKRVLAYGQQSNSSTDIQVSDTWWKISTPEK